MPKLIMIRKVQAMRPEVYTVNLGNGTLLDAAAIDAFNGRKVGNFPKFNAKTDLLLKWDADHEEMTTFDRTELQEEET